MSHGIEFLLTNFTGEFLFCVSMNNLDMFMKGPEFLEGLVTGHTLNRINKNNLYVQGLAEGHTCLLADEMGLALASWHEAKFKLYIHGVQISRPTPL